MMTYKLSSDLEFFLAEYQDKYSRLRSFQDYPGNTALIIEYENLEEGEGDAFFEKFGVGNHIFDSDLPFERANAYEDLLYILKSYDTTQYFKIHKGTPYFFLGWTAFQHLNFEKAFFYMDAAVTEDLHRMKIKKSSQATSTPSIDFMLAKQRNTVAVVITAQLENILNETLELFKTESKIDISLENFTESFISPLLYHNNKKYRSLVTALYSFFTEYGRNLRLIKLRSYNGGSIDPLLSHLFKGARILESILELKGGMGNTIKTKIKSLPILDVNTKLFQGNSAFSSAREKYDELIKNKESFQNCNFASSYIIRNTTGHSLIWNDDFRNEETYIVLYKNLVNSILWSIFKLWHITL